MPEPPAITWTGHESPALAELGTPFALAQGDGALWMLAAVEPLGQTPIALATSSDGVDWERVDLAALGIPEGIIGTANLAGDEDRIAVILEDFSSVILGSGLPWVLVREQGQWTLTGPDDITAQHLAPQGGDYAVWSTLGASWGEDGLRTVMTTLWQGNPEEQPGSIGFSELSIGGGAATLTPGDLEYQRQPPWFRDVTGSATDAERIHLLLSTPGAAAEDVPALEVASWLNDWTVTTVTAEGMHEGATRMLAAAVSGSALVVVGDEVRGTEHVASAVVLRAELGEGGAPAGEWTRIPLPLAAALTRVVATDAGFWALSDRYAPSVWFSPDGWGWHRLEQPAPRGVTALLGLPGGLVAAGPGWVHLAGDVAGVG